MSEVSKYSLSSTFGLDAGEFQFLGLNGLPKVIGITGCTKAGKTTISKRLATNYGFTFISLGGLIREIAITLGETNMTWNKLGEIGVNLRKLKGKDYLAKLAFQKLHALTKQKSNKFVLDCLLHPKEIEFFSSKCDFILLGISASQDVRIKVLRRWFEYTDTEAKNTLVERDIFEQYKFNRNDPYSPNIDKCLEQVDSDWLIEIDDGITAKTLFEPVDKIVKKLSKVWSGKIE